MSSRRWLIAAGLLLALVIGGSIVIGTRRGETDFPPDSPEGVIQRYVRAVEDKDAAAVLDVLSPAARQRCEITDIRSSFRYPENRDLRVTLRNTRVTGDRAEVKIHVTESTGSSPFDSGSFDHEETFDLVRTEGKWLIEQPTWPVYCPPPGVPRGGVAPAVPVATAVTTPTATAAPTTATPAPANR